MTKKWLRAELHNHTIHSDGKMSPGQLVDYFAQQGVDILAITDHNSVSGHAEFVSACKKESIVPILANEITTFWGHVLALGLTNYLDWSIFSPEKPEEIFDLVHSMGAVCGLAHPFRLGYPVNTGCSWLMTVKDFSRLDYIEVLNSSDKGRCLNHVATDFWLDLIRSGMRLTAVAGKDWHGRTGDESPYCTYLGSYESSPIESITKGTAYISCIGKVGVFVFNSKGNCATVGDLLEISGSAIDFELDLSETENIQDEMVIEIHDQDGLAHRCLLPAGTKLSFQTGTLNHFAVIKLFKTDSNFDNLLFLSNPIYLSAG